MPVQAKLAKDQHFTRADRENGFDRCSLDPDEYGTTDHAGAVGRYTIPFEQGSFILCAGHAAAFNEGGKAKDVPLEVSYPALAALLA